MSKKIESIEYFYTDEYFFIGFLTVSAISGIFSIFIPIGKYVLLFVTILAVILFVLNFKGIADILKDKIRAISLLSKLELIIVSVFILFILSAVVNKITCGDTQSYHAQSIQWIQKYSVVPGLGNIHGRLAFNPMFFVVSALFTFHVKDVLIFPLNGLCYLVLVVKLLALYKKENNSGTIWKAVFYILILLISLLFVLPDLNSLSPDIICSTLIIYAFLMIMNLEVRERQFNYTQIILFNIIVFSCISFKISSLFLIATILFLFNKDIFRRGLITVAMGLLVISAFIIRNYYLSGYLVYPFPAIDIFNVEWKIPLDSVKEMKSEIEGWAKLWMIPYSDVIKMKVSDWIIPWFKLLNFNNRMLLTINFLSIFTFIVMLLKKDFFLAKIQLIILMNLVFWFLMAPDPRFSYGFMFLGFSLTFAYMIKLIEYSKNNGFLRFLKIALICFFVLVVGRRIKSPVNTALNPSQWVIPAPFASVETKDYYSDFHYRVPDPEGGCFNAEIPCVPFPLSNIVLRGDNLQDGFKVLNEKP